MSLSINRTRKQRSLPLAVLTHPLQFKTASGSERASINRPAQIATLVIACGAYQSAEGDKIAGCSDYKAKDCEAKTRDPNDSARLFDHGDKRDHSARAPVRYRER